MGYNPEQCRWCDYHIHSCFSDGVLEPNEIIDRWMAEGYKHIAITDHDGIGGSREALRYIKENNLDIDFITGIEFDSMDELSDEIHILGYGIDLDSKALANALSRVRFWRAGRNDKIIKVLSRLGYNITLDDVIAVNGGRFIGKPTFARVLVNKGYFRNVGEVFTQLFDAREEFQSIQKLALGSEEAIDVIHQAGGIAIMAHPMEQLRKGEDLEDFMPRLIQIMGTLVKYGIDGIECYHPSATDIESQWLEACAKKNNLTITCGSDFHSDKDTRFI